MFCMGYDSLQKNRILKFGLKMKAVRLFYNMTARIFGGSKLPKEGEAFRDITIAEYAVENRDPKILETLLCHIYKHYKKEGYHSIIIGSDVNNPILKATDIFWSKKVRSNVILGSVEREKAKEIELQPFIYADAIQI